MLTLLCPNLLWTEWKQECAGIDEAVSTSLPPPLTRMRLSSTLVSFYFKQGMPEVVCRYNIYLRDKVARVCVCVLLMMLK
jgi:hypothetical protein